MPPDDLRATTERVVSVWQDLNSVLNDTALLASALFVSDPERTIEIEMKDGSPESFMVPIYGVKPDYAFFREKLDVARRLVDKLEAALLEWSRVSGREPFANSIPVVLKDFRRELARETVDAHQ